MQNQFWLVNGAVMRDLAWRKTFDRVIEEPTRGVIRALMTIQNLDPPAYTAKLTAAVSVVNGVSRVTAGKQIQDAVGTDIVTWEEDENDARRSIYYFAPGLESKLARLRELEVQIMSTLAAQILEPNDPNAGRNSVPKEIYFNIVDLEFSKSFKTQLNKRLDEHRKGRQKKDDRRKGANGHANI